MTYTVKNGTWCKDNDQEYFSTTETGLRAALKSGEITAGDKVVVHERKYEAGDIKKTMNPNCPEGFFRPEGQTFDVSIYTELAEIFPDGKLPDLRECVLVCAGESANPAIINHDIFDAGEFKDDTFAEHTHDRGTMEIEGNIAVQGLTHLGGVWPIITGAGGAFKTEAGTVGCADTETGTRNESLPQVKFKASDNWTGETGNAGSGNVTRTKEYGVYFYIAF